MGQQQQQQARCARLLMHPMPTPHTKNPPHSDVAAPCEFGQPIKRTRSDQSLLAVAEAAGAAAAGALVGGLQAKALQLRRSLELTSGSGESDLDDSLAAAAAATAAATAAARGARRARSLGGLGAGARLQGGAGGGAAAAAAAAARQQWQSALPVVHSDHGSSTNSLLSLESELTRSSASLPVHAAAMAQVGPLAALSTPPAQQQQQGAVTYMHASGSAVSLQHGGSGGGGAAAAAAITPIASSLLFRGHDGGALPPQPPQPPRAPAFSSQPFASAGGPAAAPRPGGGGGSAAAAAAAAAAFGEPGGLGRGRPVFGFRVDATSAAQQPQQQQAQQQQQHSGALPRNASAGSADDWDFGRRHRQHAAASVGGRTASGSSSFGRRRSSIEAAMPWRARVDGAITAAEGAEAAAAAAGAAGAGAGAKSGSACALPAVAEAPAAADATSPGARSAAAVAAAAAAWPAGRRRSSGGASPVLLKLQPDSDDSDDEGSSSDDGREDRGSGEDGAAGTSGDDVMAPAGAGAGGAARAVGRVRRACASAHASGYYARTAGAAFELFVRLNRARQTLDFSKRMANEFAALDRAEMTVWEALDALSELREYEAGLAPPGEGLDASLPLREHAFQVAELCRLAFPDKPWLALVGLIHGLGKLLAHPICGSQPQWAVAGETYPLGCRFAPQIGHHELFSANPDRRRRAFATPEGVYAPHCGLREVYMSWGAPEYLYTVLVLNSARLPEDALFVLRHQKCYSLTRPGGAYGALLSPADSALLPLLAAFQRLAVYRRVELPAAALRGQALIDHYDRLIAEYLGPERLFW